MDHREEMMKKMLAIQSKQAPTTEAEDTPEQSIEEVAIYEAAKAQERKVFDPEDVYDTLKDPNVRQKKDLCKFAESALDFYHNGGQQGFYVLDMFAHDFRHWNETHFKIIAKKTVMSIRNCLH